MRRMSCNVHLIYIAMANDSFGPVQIIWYWKIRDWDTNVFDAALKRLLV